MPVPSDTTSELPFGSAPTRAAMRWADVGHGARDCDHDLVADDVGAGRASRCAGMAAMSSIVA